MPQFFLQGQFFIIMQYITYQLKTIFSLCLSLPVLFLLLCINTSGFLLANNINPCGTKMSKSQLDWLKHNRNKIMNNISTYKKNEDDVLYVPIQFHIVGTSFGEEYFPVQSTLYLLCNVNENFRDMNIQFYNYDDFKYIPNSNYYNQNTQQGADMMYFYNVPNVVNVYIVNDPDGNCGYYIPSADGIAIAKKCADANSTTLTHELGHYFNLPHTFNGWDHYEEWGFNEMPDEWKELADGSNCATTGDYFCDTPADYLFDRWQCPYDGEPLIDPNGQEVKPDISLYMSYSLDHCQNRFSDEQKAVIKSFLTEERSYLLTFSEPEHSEVSETYLFYPAKNSINVQPDDVLLSWKAVNGANKYFLELFAPNLDKREVYTVDTFYKTNVFTALSENTVYYWSVKPYNETYTCTDDVGSSFKTGYLDSHIYLDDLEIKMPDCYGEASGSITVDADGGKKPYTYLWQDGETGESREALIADVYKVTVTDKNESSNVWLINLPQPDKISLEEVIQTGNGQAAVKVSGGTRPYQIIWESGEEGNMAENLEVGLNKLSITDNNGCLIDTTIRIMQVDALVSNITCHGETDGSIELSVSGNDGDLSYFWSNGQEGPAIEQLAKGNYQVEINDETGNIARMDFDITEPEKLTAQLVLNSSTVTINANGGTLPYTYEWPTGTSTENTVSNLPQGYEFETFVIDKNGCSFRLTFEIPVGLEDNSSSFAQHFLVYPNLVQKTNGKVFIQINNKKHSNQKITCQWYNKLGQRTGSVQQLNLYNSLTATLDIPEHFKTHNIYFLHIETIDGIKQVFKILIY